MPKQYYCCEICLSPHRTEAEAKRCEESHCPIHDIEIYSSRFVPATFDDDPWSPKSITLVLPTKHGMTTNQTTKVTYIRKDPERIPV